MIWIIERWVFFALVLVIWSLTWWPSSMVWVLAASPRGLFSSVSRWTTKSSSDIYTRRSMKVPLQHDINLGRQPGAGYHHPTPPSEVSIRRRRRQ
ncbi:hypothetical protein QBC39DRAFT_348195 [Podospora conica]|nr:hypothetical protein QBC39DRAFT_348195 [Schizothecium conicum]